jgi:hypothetical protein
MDRLPLKSIRAPSPISGFPYLQLLLERGTPKINAFGADKLHTELAEPAKVGGVAFRFNVNYPIAMVASLGIAFFLDAKFIKDVGVSTRPHITVR